MLMTKLDRREVPLYNGLDVKIQLLTPFQREQGRDRGWVGG